MWIVSGSWTLPESTRQMELQQNKKEDDGDDVDDDGDKCKKNMSSNVKNDERWNILVVWLLLKC